MRRYRALSVMAAILVSSAWVLASDVGKIPMKAGHPTIAEPRQPFATFQKLDSLLTTLDRDNQVLRAHIKQARNIHDPHAQQKALRKLRQSRAFRDMMRSSRSLKVTSRRGEALYAKRKQAYGHAMFRELHARAMALRSPLLRQDSEQTLQGFARRQDVFSSHLLDFILQFQAVSGGYGALTCDSAGWACCQPRIVKTGTRTMKGCLWTCVSKMVACRGGCLGPKLANTVPAIQAMKPKLPSAARGQDASRSNSERISSAKPE